MYISIHCVISITIIFVIVIITIIHGNLGVSMSLWGGVWISLDKLWTSQ